MLDEHSIANVGSVTLNGERRVRRGRCLSRLASSVVRWPAATKTFLVSWHIGLGISPVSDETADAFQLLGRFLVTLTEDNVGGNHRGCEDLAGTRVKQMRIKNLKPGAVFDTHRRQAVSSSLFLACRQGRVAEFVGELCGL